VNKAGMACLTDTPLPNCHIHMLWVTLFSLQSSMLW